MSNLKILHAEAQTLSRAGLKSILLRGGGVSEIQEIESNELLYEQIEEQKPDLLIIDYNQEGFFSTENIFHIKKHYPKVKILVISSDKNNDRILKVLESGVNSYITRECDEGEIINAVFAISRGDKFFCNKIIDILLQKKFTPEEQDCEPTSLTEREIEITKLIAEGLTAKEIANKLFISYHTVHTHRKNIMKKLNAKSSNELTLYAINIGLVKLK